MFIIVGFVVAFVALCYLTTEFVLWLIGCNGGSKK